MAAGEILERGLRRVRWIEGGGKKEKEKEKKERKR